MLRKLEDSKEERLKVYTYRIIGKELYVYNKHGSRQHKSMQNLTGVFIKDEPDDVFDILTPLYSFKLIFSRNKER